MLDIKVSRLQSEQRELSDRLKQIAKRLDHTERAYRKEEIPLLEKDYERQQKADKAFFDAARKAELAAAKAQHEENMRIKSRLLRMKDDYNTFKAKLEEKQRSKLEAARRAAEEAIEKEKQERIAQWRAKREEIIKKREAEEAERKRKEEEEAARKRGKVPCNWGWLFVRAWTFSRHHNRGRTQSCGKSSTTCQGEGRARRIQ